MKTKSLLGAASTQLVIAVLAVGGAELFGGKAFAQSAPAPYQKASRYDAGGRLLGTISAPPTIGVDANFLAQRQYYDEYGRLWKVESGTLSSWQDETIIPQNWSGFSLIKSTIYVFDSNGRVIKELEVGPSANALAVSQFSYDAFDRLDCSALRMDPQSWLGQTDACVAQTTGSFGSDRITRTTYDARNHPLVIQKAYGTPVQQAYATYTYSPNGKRTSVTDAKGNRAEMEYDGFDRQSYWRFPSKTTVGQASGDDYEKYDYDANGNRTSLRRRDGRTLTYTYDALNRMETKTVPGGQVVYYGYDLRGLQTYARFGSANGQGVTSSYDGFGLLASSTTTMGGVTRSLGYQYDANGNRKQLAYPDGTVVNYAYDGVDRLTAIRDASDNDLTIMTYYPNGARAWRGYGANGTGYGYDALLRLTGYNLQRNQNGTVVADNTTLLYNPASQLTQQIRSSEAYAWTGAVTADRDYGVNGLNQYTSAGINMFGYDANGNLTSEPNETYAYDAENRLISATGARSATLAYDPLGRLWQIGDIRFVYDGDAMIAEYNGSGALLNRYVHANGVDEPVLWYQGSSTTPRQLMTDHHGSIVATTQLGWSLANINTYDEYGIPGANNDGRFQYTGQMWLPELGLYYYKARVYSPSHGRFLQTDPIGYDDQINLYAYVANDPVNGKDPSGKERCEGPQKVCGQVAASIQKVRDGADKSPSESNLRITALRYGEPGKGTKIIVDDGITRQANTSQTDGSVHVKSSSVVIPEFGGQVLSHEGPHAEDFADNGPVKTGKERMDTEVKAYSVQNEYSRAMGMAEVDVEKSAAASFNSACSRAPTSPSCK